MGEPENETIAGLYELRNANDLEIKNVHTHVLDLFGNDCKPNRDELIVKINLYLFSPMKATLWNLVPESIQTVHIYSHGKKICTILVVECSCVHAQATCSLFCSESDMKCCVRP